MSRFFLFLFLFIPGLTTIAQDITVVDTRTGDPIEGVVIQSANELTQTGPGGKARLDAFPRETQIVFRHPSYLPVKTSLPQIRSRNFRVTMTESPVALDEVVISVNRGEQFRSEVPNKVEILKPVEVLRYHPATTADLAGLSAEVFIQKSQQGGGSPMMRGFSANRLLLVIDGVRMNNAIYRSGNLQNVVSLDAHMLESTEIVPGPGSVIYGSDALGGVLSFLTWKPRLNTSANHQAEGIYRLQYSSANNAKTAHLRWGSGNPHFAFLMAATVTDFGDLRMGSHGPEEYLRPEYVTQGRFTGADLIRQNQNPLIQRYSGYQQINMMTKFRVTPSEKLDFNLGIHFSALSDVHRYDRLIVYRQGKLRYGTWKYGPQKWGMASANLLYRSPHLLFDKANLTAAIQYARESRHDRNLDDSLLYNRSEQLAMTTLTLDFTKKTGNQSHLAYGLEGAWNLLNSAGHADNLLSESAFPIAPRYPDNSTHRSFALYGSGDLAIRKDLFLHGGIRGNLTLAKGKFDPGFYNLSFHGFNTSQTALNGNTGLVWHPTLLWKFNLMGSTGFRAPNLDDMAKVFDSEPGNVIVPNPGLKPEYARNLEAGVVRKFGSTAKIEVTFFWTVLKNAMVRRSFLYNGQDSILYNGVMSKVEALVNTSKARILGTSITADYYFSPALYTRHRITNMYGKDSDGYPVRHVPPLYGYSSLAYHQKLWFAEIDIRYNGKIPYQRLATDERDKPYLYLSDKDRQPYSPAWYTLNFHATLEITPGMTAAATLENILDRRYLPYSSGIAAPGRNLVISVTGKW